MRHVVDPQRPDESRCQVQVRRGGAGKRGELPKRRHQLRPLFRYPKLLLRFRDLRATVRLSRGERRALVT